MTHHFETTHPSLGRECPVCLQSFSAMKVLEHLLSKHKITNFETLQIRSFPLTDEITSAVDIEPVQETEKREKDPYRNGQCPLCSKSYSVQKAVYRHVRNSHKMTFKEAVDESKRESGLNGKHKCPTCPRTFARAGYLFMHSNRCENRVNVKSEFEADSGLSVKREKSPVRLEKCPMCFKETRGMAPLLQHVRHVHDMTLSEAKERAELSETPVVYPRLPHECSTCQRGFGQDGDLLKHQKYCQSEPKTKPDEVMDTVKVLSLSDDSSNKISPSGK